MEVPKKDGYYVKDGYYECVKIPYIVEDTKKKIDIEIPIQEVEFPELPLDDSCKKYMVKCIDKDRLSEDRILKTLSIMKNKLATKCEPYEIDNIECRMGGKAKENLITAYKKLSMYGRELPSVMCFDECFRPLPNKRDINVARSMRIYVYDYFEYDGFYMSFETTLYGLPKINKK